MHDFRGRRQQFRREVNGLQRGRGDRNGSRFMTCDLGTRLATFKVFPCTDLNTTLLTSEKPLFCGTCSRCTTHSDTTYIKGSVEALLGIRDALKGRMFVDSTANPSIDFRKAFENSSILNTVIELQQEEEENNVDTQAVIKQMNLPKYKKESFLDGLYKILKGWLWKLTLKIMFPGGIFYHPGQLEVLERSAKSGLPLVFLPVHKSNMDSHILTSVLAQTRSNMEPFVVHSSSTFQVGCNKSSFNLLANIDNDLNWAVQQTVFQTILGLPGHHLIIDHMEKQACKDGQPDPNPDVTCLDHVLEALGCAQQPVQDCNVVPVGINYDILPTSPQPFLRLIKMWLGLENNCGSVRVDFDQPFSVKEFSSCWEKRLGGVADDYFHSELVWCLGKHVLWSSYKMTKLMATNMVAFLLLYKFSTNSTKGSTKMASFVNSFESLCQDCVRRHLFLGFSGQPEDVAKYGLKKLNIPIVNGDIIVPENVLLESLLLGYGNSVLPVYIEESLVALSLSSLLDVPIKAYRDTHVTVSIRKQELFESTRVLLDLLCLEFTWKLPCVDTQKVIEDAIDRLKLREIIYVPQQVESEHFQARWSRRVAKQLDMDTTNEDGRCLEAVNDDTVYNVAMTNEAFEQVTFLISLVSPIVERFYYTVDHLKSVLLLEEDGVKVTRIEFLRQIQDKHYGGKCTNTSNLLRVMSRLEMMGVIYYCNNSSNEDVVNVSADNWCCSKLDGLLSRVHQYMV